MKSSGAGADGQEERDGEEPVSRRILRRSEPMIEVQTAEGEAATGYAERIKRVAGWSR